MGTPGNQIAVKGQDCRHIFFYPGKDKGKVEYHLSYTSAQCFRYQHSIFFYLKIANYSM